MYHTNKWRDRVYGPANKVSSLSLYLYLALRVHESCSIFLVLFSICIQEASDEAGMRDQTEFENKDFRYVL